MGRAIYYLIAYMIVLELAKWYIRLIRLLLGEWWPLQRSTHLARHISIGGSCPTLGRMLSRLPLHCYVLVLPTGVHPYILTRFPPTLPYTVPNYSRGKVPWCISSISRWKNPRWIKLHKVFMKEKFPYLPDECLNGKDQWEGHYLIQNM